MKRRKRRRRMRRWLDKLNGGTRTGTTSWWKESKGEKARGRRRKRVRAEGGRREGDAKGAERRVKE